jgi:hypothetical protein
MTDRDLLASADPGTVAQEATQETEDRIGLDKAKRRDVQRQLTGPRLRHQGQRTVRQADPRRHRPLAGGTRLSQTGFLDTLQHQALLAESVSTARASLGSDEKSEDARPARRRGGGHHRSSGGPGGLIGGVVGGLFGTQVITDERSHARWLIESERARITA